MNEKRGKGIYFGRFPTADVFFPSCVSQDPDICVRGRTSCSYLIPHPQISQIVFLFTDSQIQSKSLSSCIPRTCKERKWAIEGKKKYIYISIYTFARNWIGEKIMIPYTGEDEMAKNCPKLAQQGFSLEVLFPCESFLMESAKPCLPCLIPWLHKATLAASKTIKLWL